MKGFEMPSNAIVILVASVIIFVMIWSFITTVSVRQMSTADAQRIFSVDCRTLCSTDSEENYATAYEILKNKPDFVKACTVLGYGSAEYPNRCLERCGCDMYVREGSVGEKIGNVTEMLENLG